MIIHVARAEIGQWYAQAGSDELFRVVGLDERSQTIELQSLEGDLGEIDAETWSALKLRHCPYPEGRTGPRDDVDSCDRCDLTGRSLSGRDVLTFLQAAS